MAAAHGRERIDICRASPIARGPSRGFAGQRRWRSAGASSVSTRWPTRRDATWSRTAIGASTIASRTSLRAQVWPMPGRCGRRSCGPVIFAAPSPRAGRWDTQWPAALWLSAMSDPLNGSVPNFSDLAPACSQGQQATTEQQPRGWQRHRCCRNANVVDARRLVIASDGDEYFAERLVLGHTEKAQ